MQATSVVFLSLLINRLTELLKRTVVSQLDWSDEAQGGLVLVVSFVIGILGVVFLFPATNLVPDAGAATPLAAQIVTGIIIAGLANGIDFLPKAGDAILDRLSPTPPAPTVNVVVPPAV